jgi:hypothetical protein
VPVKVCVPVTLPCDFSNCKGSSPCTPCEPCGGKNYGSPCGQSYGGSCGH